MGKIKTYEIEIASEYALDSDGKNYRTYYIDADSQDEAEMRAFQELDADWEISKAWRQNAEITHVAETEKKYD